MHPSSSALAAALAVLGLPPDADRDQVTRAYRRLARITHPDVSSSPQAAARFEALTNAYRLAVEGAAPPFTEGTVHTTLSAGRDPLEEPGTHGERRHAAPGWTWSLLHQRVAPIVAGPVRVEPWPEPCARRESPPRRPGGG